MRSLVAKGGEEENEVALVGVGVFSGIRLELSCKTEPKMVSSSETAVAERKLRISYGYVVVPYCNPWFFNFKPYFLVQKVYRTEGETEKTNYLVVR